jgi:hypothetical protein
LRSIARHPAALAALLAVLLLGVAVGWLLSQLQLVRNRRAFSEHLRQTNKADLVASLSAATKLSWLRRYFDDLAVEHVVRYSAMTDDDQQKVADLFPEASTLWSGGNPELLRSLQSAAIQPAAAHPTPASSPVAAVK